MGIAGIADAAGAVAGAGAAGTGDTAGSGAAGNAGVGAVIAPTAGAAAGAGLGRQRGCCGVEGGADVGHSGLHGGHPVRPNIGVHERLHLLIDQFTDLISDRGSYEQSIRDANLVIQEGLERQESILASHVL